MKLIILDRDGVINEDSDAYIRTVEEWIPLPGAIEAIARLSQAGWTIAVASNQSGVGRGYFNLTILDAMHARLRQLVAEQGGRIDHLVYCPHTPEDRCECRKPSPGMLKQIALHFGLNHLQGIWFVGDSISDLKAAEAVGCQPVLVKTGKGQRTLERPLPENTLIFDDLAAVAQKLLG